MGRNQKRKRGECFVIAPIGEDHSSTRERTEKVSEFIIGPAAEHCGYDVNIAHRMSTSGMISTDIVTSIVEAPLVIADLTEGNANVFYELSLRHVIGKPVVQIVQKSHPVPFDVHNVRTIKYALDVEEAAKAKDELVRVIEALDESPSSNPILQANKLSVYFVEDAAGPDDLKSMLDSLFLAHRVRYKVIEGFFDRKYDRDDEARIARLSENVQAVLRESESRGFTQSTRMFHAFGRHEAMGKRTFEGAGEILPNLLQAISQKDVDKISEHLYEWRQNNDLYILVAMKRCQEIIDENCDPGVLADFVEYLKGEERIDEPAPLATAGDDEGGMGSPR
jgi:hypothetical protein